MSALDCIVIGYNDIPFQTMVARHQPLQGHSGTYGELKTNSVLIGGQRRNYMDLLNYSLERLHGQSPHLNAFEAPNLGAVYLASNLRRQGFDVELVNLFNFERERLKALLRESPHAVAITTTYYVDDDPIKELVNFIRRHSDSTRIIVGGPYIHNLCTGAAEGVQENQLKALGADIYIHDSQGEATLARVIQCLRDDRASALPAVPNLLYHEGTSLLRTRREVEKNNLDANAVDWKLFNPRFFTPTTYMRTARSCPFACAFCNYPAMSGAHTVSEIDTIRAELRYLTQAGVKYVIFIDDTFNVPLPRFKKLCQMMIDEQFDIQWISFFRCGNADDACFDLMKKSGCLGVYLGIESGDDQILKNMNKYATISKYREGIRKLHERGILTFGSFIVGYPGETQESVMNTVRFLQDTPTTFFNVQLYFHDPIAPISRRKEEFGIEGEHYNWRHNTMAWEEGAEWVEYLLHTTGKSIPLTLYGFSIWSIPYLLQNGFTLDQIKGFASAAKKMLVKGFDDVEKPYTEEFADLKAVLGSWNPSMRKPRLDSFNLMR